MSGRAYTGADDLRLMQAAVSSACDAAALHIGDLAYLARCAPHRDLRHYIRIWEDSGGVSGFAFLRSNGGFNLFLSPTAAPGLVDDMLDFVDTAAAEFEVAGDAPLGLYTYGIDESRSDVDREIAQALRGRGFVESTAFGGVVSRTLDALPAADVASGYAVVAADDELVDSRVEAQRAVFPPSVFTVETYRRARGTWPYRTDLDRVVIDASGGVVAFCTAWIDETTGNGMLEPVGVHPAHRRRGLGRAVCLDALRHLHDSGARHVYVAYNSDEGLRLYESMEFTHASTDTNFRRP